MVRKVSDPKPTSISELPDDELLGYGRELGLDLREGTPRGELLRLVRERQELLLELDREAMLDVVVWGRRPVRRSASKEALARQITLVQRTDLELLSDRGLKTYARLRGVMPRSGEAREDLERRLAKAIGLWASLRRARRRMLAGLIARTVERQESGEYRFLPEEERGSLRRSIENEGVVGGIAHRLKGVADDYVREKLDEIERRIDRKLDEIDQRMGEWRDRELSNRLRILKITLLVSVLVALISLGYDVVTARLLPGPPAAGALQESSMPRGSGGHETNATMSASRTADDDQGHVRAFQSSGRQGGEARQ